MSMKATGTYLSRTLSYEGAEFALARVAIDPVFEIMYDRSAQFWMLLSRFLFPILPGKAIRQFYGAHQRFFRQMLMAAKVPACAQMALEAVDTGLAVVIGLQSTGEAATTAADAQRGQNAEDEFDDLVSAPRLILESFLAKNYPTTVEDTCIRTITNLAHQIAKVYEAWQELPPASVEARRRANGSSLAVAPGQPDAGLLMGLGLAEGAHLTPQQIAEAEELFRRAAEEQRQREYAAAKDAWETARATQETDLLLDHEEAAEELETARAKLMELEAEAEGKAGPQQGLSTGSKRRRLAKRDTPVAAVRPDAGGEDSDSGLMIMISDSEQEEEGAAVAAPMAGLQDLEDDLEEGAGGDEQKPQQVQASGAAKRSRLVISDSEEGSDQEEEEGEEEYEPSGDDEILVSSDEEEVKVPGGVDVIDLISDSEGDKDDGPGVGPSTRRRRSGRPAVAAARQPAASRFTFDDIRPRRSAAARRVSGVVSKARLTSMRREVARAEAALEEATAELEAFRAGPTCYEEYLQAGDARGRRRRSSANPAMTMIEARGTRSSTGGRWRRKRWSVGQVAKTWVGRAKAKALTATATFGCRPMRMTAAMVMTAATLRWKLDSKRAVGCSACSSRTLSLAGRRVWRRRWMGRWGMGVCLQLSVLMQMETVYQVSKTVFLMLSLTAGCITYFTLSYTVPPKL